MYTSWAKVQIKTSGHFDILSLSFSIWLEWFTSLPERVLIDNMLWVVLYFTQFRHANRARRPWQMRKNHAGHQQIYKQERVN